MPFWSTSSAQWDPEEAVKTRIQWDTAAFSIFPRERGGPLVFDLEDHRLPGIRRDWKMIPTWNVCSSP
ncbi:hypothetical protein FRC18_011858, partial [Serendipita sp. 400]